MCSTSNSKLLSKRKNKKFFFDLEQTLISIWGDPVISNRQWVTELIAAEGVKDISIFSFACWHDKDRDHFNSTMKEWLEDVFGFQIVSVPTVEDIARVVRKVNCCDFHIHDIISLWGKQRSFEDFVLFSRERDTEFVLVDDAVPNKVVDFPDLEITIRFIKC